MGCSKCGQHRADLKQAVLNGQGKRAVKVAMSGVSIMFNDAFGNKKSKAYRDTELAQKRAERATQLQNK